MLRRAFWALSRKEGVAIADVERRSVHVVSKGQLGRRAIDFARDVLLVDAIENGKAGVAAYAPNGDRPRFQTVGQVTAIEATRSGMGGVIGTRDCRVIFVGDPIGTVLTMFNVRPAITGLGFSDGDAYPPLAGRIGASSSLKRLQRSRAIG